ncbi:hypothetical protein C4588_03530 [Candidatus Parcubacteria bacterium]|nr:MAG: hypothetical protein C4588_03530 [Candidatus Parcubacteria bacterium]
MQKIGLFLGTAVVILVLVSLADFSAAITVSSVNYHFGKDAIKEDVIQEGNDFPKSFDQSMIIMESPSPAQSPIFTIMAANSTKNWTSVTTVVEFVDIGDKPRRL